MPHQLYLTNTSISGAALPLGGAGPPSARGLGLAEHPPGVGEPLTYNPSVPLVEARGVEQEFLGGALWRNTDDRRPTADD